MDGITAGQDMSRVTVSTQVPYEVLIGRGLLDRCGELVGDVVPPCRCVVVSDDTVAALYLERTRASLETVGFKVSAYVFASGEEHKTLGTYGDILGFCAREHLTRTDLIVALGGGVVGDMAGCVAATYLRGIRFVQVPTTMLACVDASVGGKTAIDLEEGKNLVGAFHQPSLVICDTDTLDTLPHETFACGMAEVIKYGVLGDEAFFSLLPHVVRSMYGHIIERCVRMKRDYVEQDEREAGARRFLNLGHTVGHAIERCSGYGIPHGDAVACGMVIICRACEARGEADLGTTERVASMCRVFGLPVETRFSADELAEAALADKKRSGDRVTVVGVRRVGDCFLKSVATSELRDLIALGLGE